LADGDTDLRGAWGCFQGGRHRTQRKGPAKNPRLTTGVAVDTPTGEVEGGQGDRPPSHVLCPCTDTLLLQALVWPPGSSPAPHAWNSRLGRWQGGVSQVAVTGRRRCVPLSAWHEASAPLLLFSGGKSTSWAPRGRAGPGGQLTQTPEESILWEEEAVASNANLDIFQNFMEKASLKITIFKKKKTDPFTNDKILFPIRKYFRNKYIPYSLQWDN